MVLLDSMVISFIIGSKLDNIKPDFTLGELLVARVVLEEILAALQNSLVDVRDENRCLTAYSKASHSHWSDDGDEVDVVQRKDLYLDDERTFQGLEVYLMCQVWLVCHRGVGHRFQESLGQMNIAFYIYCLF